MENRKLKIIEAAKKASQIRTSDGTVSEYTKNAQAIAKEWRNRCWELSPDTLQLEVLIHPTYNEKIDILDNQEMCAYEYKVSGNNATNEFYKDVVKVLMWNESRTDKRINKLVFITEEITGKKHLDKQFIVNYIKYLLKLGLKVEIEYT
ncbi:hypothetical protein ACFLTH_08885 [Bacteroidota bacterium]